MLFCLQRAFILVVAIKESVMKRIWIILLMIVSFFVVSHAQNTTSSENWTGVISIGAQKLGIGFKIKVSTDGKHMGTMDVPAQGAKNIPVEITKNDTDSLCISITALRANYKGRKASPESIEGRFSQNGMTFPLNMKPGKVELKRPQTPEPPYPYATEEVIFKNEAEGATLSGTLTYPINYFFMPKESVPVVLFVTGSGGQDRNEEVFGHKPFQVIADYLAKRGIASLRYDDRGVGKSTGPMQGATTMNNLADAEAGIAFLRSLNKFGKVGVIGHSEGGTIAFMMGANKSVDFLVSLAGSAASGLEVIIGQNKAAMQLQGVPPMVIEDYAKALDILYKDRVARKQITNQEQYVEDLCKNHSLTLPANFKSNLVKCITAGGEWLTWFLGYHPSEAIRQITCPTMALNGTLDLQVLSKDNLPVIRTNLPHNEKHLIKEYDSLNHLFQHCTPVTALNYGGIEETISKEVLRDLADWILEISI